jgi:flagellar biosynthesis/type III secretory pathway protein FliH
MSKTSNHKFPTTSVLNKRPTWMETRSEEVRDLVLKKTSKSDADFVNRSADDRTRSRRSSRPPSKGSVSVIPANMSLGAEQAEIVAQLEARVQAFTQAAVDLATTRAGVLSTIEEQVLDLSIAIASVIIEREIQQDPGLYKELVREAIHMLGSTRSVTLKASKDTYTMMLQVLGGDVVDVDGIEVRIALDLTIDGLGCIVESGESRVDITIADRLRAIRQAIENERRTSTGAA